MNMLEEVYSVEHSVQVMVIIEDNPGDYPYVEWMGNHILYRDSMHSLALLNVEIKRHSMVIARSSEFDELILYVEDLEEKEKKLRINKDDKMDFTNRSEEIQDMVESEGNDFVHPNEEKTDK